MPCWPILLSSVLSTPDVGSVGDVERLALDD